MFYNIWMSSLSTVSVWNSTSSASSSSSSIPSSYEIFFESSTYSPVKGYLTSLTLATKIDNFLGSSHVTDTFIGISNPPCTNGEAIGFFWWTSASTLAPSPIKNQMYQESFLGTRPTTINPIFPFIMIFPVTANLS